MCHLAAVVAAVGVVVDFAVVGRVASADAVARSDTAAVRSTNESTIRDAHGGPVIGAHGNAIHYADPCPNSNAVRNTDIPTLASADDAIANDRESKVESARAICAIHVDRRRARNRVEYCNEPRGMGCFAVPVQRIAALSEGGERHLRLDRRLDAGSLPRSTNHLRPRRSPDRG